MSRREAERQRTTASARTNEYFVPKNGIDREVITADICRYLGNDALVRPGTYLDPQTRTSQNGYIINAYRNLTSAMISDLRQDSERWDAERRQSASRGHPTNAVRYHESNTHNARQHYGPTENGQSSGYPPSSSASAPTGNAYDSHSGSQYQQSGYAQPSSAYNQPQFAPTEAYYVAGGDLRAETGSERSHARGAPAASVNVPRSNTYGAATPPYQQDSRGTYNYPAPPPAAAQTQPVYASQQDYYGRAVPVTASYASQDPYDSRYQDSGYSQPAATSSVTATANSSTRRLEREPEERSRHHGSSGRRR